jgi:hypothetical protein
MPPKTKPDPNNPTIEIVMVKPPEINPVSMAILDTMKIAKSVSMMQEQFTFHLAQCARRKTFTMVT